MVDRAALPEVPHRSSPVITSTHDNGASGLQTVR